VGRRIFRLASFLPWQQRRWHIVDFNVLDFFTVVRIIVEWHFFVVHDWQRI
jgi:hypothetical protein